MSDDESWFWDQHIDQLKVNGAGSGDLAVLLSACKWWGQFRQLETVVAKSWEYRMFCAMSMAWKNFNTAASRLGLSPTERAKLRVQPNQNGNRVPKRKRA